MDIHWPTLIRALLDSGMTQPLIAEVCCCGQSTVSDMLNGKTTDPRTSLGLRMLALASERGAIVPDPTWPHPDGRPCRDYAAAPQEVSDAA